MGHIDDVAAPRAKDSADRARRSSRLVVVKCQREYGPEVSITIRNTSATGLRGESGEVADFREGEPVLLMFRNMAPIAANVVWCEAGEVAFTFGKSIEIDRVLRAHTTQVLPEQSPRAETTLSWIEQAQRQRTSVQEKLKVSGKRPV